jgi:hypothetical protein
LRRGLGGVHDRVYRLSTVLQWGANKVASLDHDAKQPKRSSKPEIADEIKAMMEHMEVEKEGAHHG